MRGFAKRIDFVSIIGLLISLTILAVSLGPIFLPSFFPIPSRLAEKTQKVLSAFAGVIPLLACMFCYTLHRQLPRHQRLGLVCFFMVAAGYIEYIHFTFVDQAHYFPVNLVPDNLQWQVLVQRHVVALSSDVIPHSYRFLPNGLVAFLEWMTGSFVYARIVYRLTFSCLIINFIYYYARYYVSHYAAMLAVLFYLLVFPVSIACYAGQLNDPMSHLSFLLAMIFIKQNRFFCFALTLTLGVLAKESVVIMLLCYLVCTKEPRLSSLVKGGILSACCLMILILVRLLVTGGNLGYHEVSGVDLGHVLTNLKQKVWPWQFAFTVGLFLLPVAIYWQHAPRDLKYMSYVLVPGILVPSLFFSWLTEARNYIPIVIVFAIITARFIESTFPAGQIEISIRDP